MARYIREVTSERYDDRCVTESDLHPLRRDVSGRESGDGRSDVDDLPAVRAGGWHSRHRLRPGPRAGGVAERSRWQIGRAIIGGTPSCCRSSRAPFATIGRLAGRRSSIRRGWPSIWACEQILLKDEGRNPTGVVQGPGQLGRRCPRVASRREDDRLRVDRQRGQQPGRSRGAGRPAGVSSSCRTLRRSRRSRSCRCSARRCSP